MKRIAALLAVIMVITLVSGYGASAKVSAQATKPLVIYMQMGGYQSGDYSTLARITGAEAAAKALGVELHEQYANWNPDTMIDQFNQAITAKPDCIEIMGHPGEGAMAPLVDQAETAGIVVTSGNTPMPNIEAKYQAKGFGYAGADPYNGATLTVQAMVAAGLKAGDEALVYDVWNLGVHSRSQGMFDALTKAGLKVDKLDVTSDVDTNPQLAIPILAAYIAAHPNLKAIATQHGMITSILPKVFQQAGKKPGEILGGGIDLWPDTIAGIKAGYIVASLDQLVYLQGYYPVQQCWLTKNYLIPGLHLDTGVGEVTPQNVAHIVPLIQAGYR